MADKPVIDISVKSADFDRFLALYEGYNESLDEQPKKWAAISDAMGGAGTSIAKGFDSGAASLALAKTQAFDLSKNISSAAKAQLSFASAIGLSEKQFSSLGKASINTVQGVTKAFSGAVGGSIAEMGAGFAGVAEGALSALGPVGIAVGAIAGAIGGAAFGLYKLSDAAVTRQRAAFSVGVTPGQRSSFDINAQQFLDPSALDVARNAQLSYASGGALATLGIGFEDARKMSPDQLAFKMLEQATKAAQAQPNTPLENIPAIAQYMRLGGNVGDVQNALKMGLPALEAARSATAKNATRLNIDQSAVAQSAALKKSVESAGVTVQSAAINRLSGADPIIAKALGALTGDANAGASVAHAFQAVTNAVTQHVEPAFKNVASAVTHNVQPALHALQSGAHNAANALGAVWHAVTTSVIGKDIGRAGAYALAASAKFIGPHAADINAVAKKYGIPPDLLAGLALQEHGGAFSNADQVGGDGKGWFQIDAGYHAAWLKAHNMGHDFKSAADYAASMVADEWKRSHDYRAIGQLYNAGHVGGKTTVNDRGTYEQGLASAITQAAEMSGGIALTKNDLSDALYQAIMKANAATQRKQPKAPSHQPHITVRNSTSARVAVSVNAAAQG